MSKRSSLNLKQDSKYIFDPVLDQQFESALRNTNKVLFNISKILPNIDLEPKDFLDVNIEREDLESFNKARKNMIKKFKYFVGIYGTLGITYCAFYTRKLKNKGINPFRSTYAWIGFLIPLIIRIYLNGNETEEVLQTNLEKIQIKNISKNKDNKQEQELIREKFKFYKTYT